MKKRTEGFLANELINHNSEQFDYISELHNYLWRFIRCELPNASGRINDYIDIALEQCEKRVEVIKDILKNNP